MTNSQQRQQNPVRRQTPAEIRAAKYANRPPAPQVVFIQPPLHDGGYAYQQSNENRSQPKMKTVGLRMTKPAAEAARRSNLDESQIRAVLETPNDVEPDRDNPDRTRFTKGSLIVVTGKDGVVIGIYKR
jgi:hypothetical protein